VSDRIRSVLRWILGVDETPSVELSGDDLAFLSEVSAAAFAITLDLRFGENATPDQTKEFIARVRGPIVNPEKLNPVLAEWVILTAYGAPGLLDQVSLAETVTAQNLISYAVVRDMQVTGADLEQLMDDVVDLITSPDEEGD
jgi:hypothetical protein